MRIVGVIPARYGSQRLPGKPLAMIAGKPMIRWVYEGARKSRFLGRIIVATDDVRVMRTVWNFGGEAMLTSKQAKSGTDRVAEAVKKIPADIIVNIQGDEPLISDKVIDRTILPFQKDKRLLMATAASPLRDETEASSPDIVKVVVDQQENALYFSRSPLPYHRQPHRGFRGYYRHCGIYVYRRSFLLRFTKWKQTPLELTESLEQLRPLERGIRMRVVIVNQSPVGVDRTEDLGRVEAILKKKKA